MSSFKRKITSKTQSLLGTRPSPGSATTIVTSTGIPSLDDILGGGLPLSCSLVVTAPDPHSSYGELVQKSFVSQGIACKQDVIVVGGDQDTLEWVKSCMWFHGSTSFPDDEDEDRKLPEEEQKIKIAWRYEQMKQFQTTVGSTPSNENFCRTFDLTTRIPSSVIDKAILTGQLITYDVFDDNSDDLHPESSSRPHLASEAVILYVEKLLSKRSSASSATPLRICIPTLGSSAWGDLRSQDILRFLHILRALLRRHSAACASISLSPHISSETWGGPGWTQKLGWMCDGLITLDAFTANPSLSILFPSHHGMVHIHTLPSPHSLLAPSDRFSTLRGLAASATEAGSSGENNLAFKCTRKRLIFETMHLDVEGGVGERRTTPAPSTGALEPEHTHLQSQTNAALASVQVEVELHQVHKPTVVIASVRGTSDEAATQAPKARSKKPKKTVAFQSDRPDLYDF